MPQHLRRFENPIKHRGGSALEVHRLTTPIVTRRLPLHPAVLLKSIQNACECRLFNADPRCDFLLRKLVRAPRKMDERGPFALAQTERPQTLIELRPPDARGIAQEQTDFFYVAIRFQIVSLLTIRRLSSRRAAESPPREAWIPCR